MLAITRNNVLVSGAGSQPLVLVHGFGCAQSVWHRLAPELERHYCVVRLDLTGLGHTNAKAYDPARYVSLQAHADDLLEVVAALGLADVYVVGHSCGATISLLAAAREPARFRKLALVACSPCYLDEPGYRGGLQRADVEQFVSAICGDYGAWVERTAPLVSAEPAGSPIAAEVMGEFRLHEPIITAHFARVMLLADHRNILPEVAVETLVVQATRDPFVPESAARYLAEHLPRARLRMVTGRGGHYPHLGAPQELLAVLGDFFGQA